MVLFTVKRYGGCDSGAEGEVAAMRALRMAFYVGVRRIVLCVVCVAKRARRWSIVERTDNYLRIPFSDFGVVVSFCFFQCRVAGLQVIPMSDTQPLEI